MKLLFFIVASLAALVAVPSFGQNEGGETTPGIAVRGNLVNVMSGGFGPGNYRTNSGTRLTAGNFKALPTLNVVRFTVASEGHSVTVDAAPTFEDPKKAEALPPTEIGGGRQFKVEEGKGFVKQAGSDEWEVARPMGGDQLGDGEGAEEAQR